METVFSEWCSKIKIIVSEIDGIVTDHKVYIDELGNVPFKSYHMGDFEIINELKKTFTFIFLSSDNSISYHLCRRRSIPFFYAPKDKKEGLIRVMRRYNVAPEEIVYIGCSLSDLNCVKLIPFSLCPSDAVNNVKEVSYYVLESYGGEGVLCEVYGVLKPEIAKRRISDCGN